MSLSKSEYVIIWSRRSLIPCVIVIFASREAVALAPKSRVLAGSGAVIGGALGAGSVGAIPLSGCGDQLGLRVNVVQLDFELLIHSGLRLRSS